MQTLQPGWPFLVKAYMQTTFGIINTQCHNALELESPLTQLWAIECNLPPRCGEALHIVTNHMMSLPDPQGRNCFFREGVLAFWDQINLDPSCPDGPPISVEVMTVLQELYKQIQAEELT